MGVEVSHDGALSRCADGPAESGLVGQLAAADGAEPVVEAKSKPWRECVQPENVSQGTHLQRSDSWRRSKSQDDFVSALCANE
jgi:hypothetical protein